MAGNSKKRAVNEWEIEVADLEQRYSWFDDVKGKFEFHKAEDDKPDEKSRKFSSVSIIRVPMYLKGLNKDSCVPRVVSLGLFHHRMSQPLSEIELYKVEAVNRSVKRLPQNQQHARFLVEKVQRLLPEITASYEGKLDCEEEILAWLFTLDGCFILETLRLRSDESQWYLNGNSQWNLDPVFNRNRVRSCQFDILTDLLLLENQVPIVLLLGLLEMEDDCTEEKARIELLRMICDSIVALAHPFSYSLQPKTGESPTQHEERETKLKLKYKNLKQYNHILGFFHDFIVHDSETTGEGEKAGDVHITVPEGSHHHYLPGLHLHKTAHKPKKESHYQYLVASATELYNNGMKFKSYEGVPSAKDLRFDEQKKTLFLPVIWISDATDLIFRNLMTVDVCQEKELTVISEYVFLMNSLIQCEKDVALLRKKGIIQSSIGTDEEASYLFNHLCKGVNFTFADEDKFMKLKITVNGWYKRRSMVRINDFMDKNPKFVKIFTIFWGVFLVLAAASPSSVQIITQLNKH